MVVLGEDQLGRQVDIVVTRFTSHAGRLEDHPSYFSVIGRWGEFSQLPGKTQETGPC